MGRVILPPRRTYSLMPVSFDQPAFLLALLLLPLFAAVSLRGSLADLDPLRRSLSLALRLTIVASIVFALAGMNWVRRSGANCTLFLIDASYSMPRRDRQRALDIVNEATGKMRAEDKVGVILIGAEPRLAFEPSLRGKIACELTVPDGSQTNLARGVTSALSYFPDDAARRIVLLSDGNETTGSLLEAARSAASEETPIDVLPLGSAPDREALLERMLTPPIAKRGEPFPIKVVANSISGGPGTLRLYRNGESVGEQRVDLQPGKNVLTVEGRADKPGFYAYEARLVTPNGADTYAENNRAVSFVAVEGKPRLLLIQPRDPLIPDDYLPPAMAAQNVQVEVGTPRDLPTQAASLAAYDGVILSDVPADSLSNAQMRTIQASVRDLGMGLTMIGGDLSFGAGGYYQTPIEEALPVDLNLKKMKRLPGVALALAMDYSGSMNSQGQNTPGSQSKLDLAKEATDQAVDLLNVQDQVGVLAVDTQANVIVPLQYVTNKRKIHQGVAAINGGAGTEMSAAVKGCLALLKNADAKVRHAILVSDGETGPYDYAPLIAELRKAKITFSLVIIDEGQGAAGIDPLKRVVRATGGRFYRVLDASQIPKIFLRETQTISKPPILEEPFIPRLATPGSPLVSGTNWAGVPPLLGYDVVNAKPTAEVALASHKGDPVLASWQYGLGKTVAFTSDAKARWGAQWLQWPGYSSFWAQILRWSLRKSDTGSYQSAAELVGSRGRISVDAVDDKTGAFVNFVDATARVVGPDGASQTVRLVQTGPGRYAGSFDAGKTGSYVAAVTQKTSDGKTRIARAGLSVSYSPEYAALKPNTALLLRAADITGGRALKSGAEVFAERRERRLPQSLVLFLLTLALLLFPFDVAVRRLQLRPVAEGTVEVLNSARATVRENLAARRPNQEAQRERAAASSVGRLATRKNALSSEPDDDSPPPVSASVEPDRPAVVWSSKPQAAPIPSAAPTANPEPAGDYLSRLREAKKRAAKPDEDLPRSP
ncbi:MAG: VWA domain-containing protein [Cytophagales bacterium]|nr:VWA domain-containing protein [Armatimonadota bacterium]